jgi:CheY-like chemotaxis protein
MCLAGQPGELALEDQPIILVIEDDDAVQGVIEDALTEGGFEPAIAASGEEAVTLLKGRITPYRALVADINLLGKLDGWEVAKQARSTRLFPSSTSPPGMQPSGPHVAFPTASF